MKLESIVAVLGGTKVIATASSAAMLAGLIYLVDCRVNAKGAEGIDRCYFTALPMMGIGIAGRGGFSAGYNTYNPALRKEEEGDKEVNEGQANERRKQRQRRKREKSKPGAEQTRGQKEENEYERLARRHSQRNID